MWSLISCFWRLYIYTMLYKKIIFFDFPFDWSGHLSWHKMVSKFFRPQSIKFQLAIRIEKKFSRNIAKAFGKNQLNEDKMHPFPTTEIKREYLITSSVYCTRSRIENITRMISLNKIQKTLHTRNHNRRELVKGKFDSGIDFAMSAKRRTFADTHDFRLTYTHVIIITIVHVQVINVVSVYVYVCICVRVDRGVRMMSDLLCYEAQIALRQWLS